MVYGHGKVNKHLIGERFGYEDGFALVPSRYSNVKLARFLYRREESCEMTFPHGNDNPPSTYRRDLLCWKTNRKHHFRIHKAAKGNMNKGEEMATGPDEAEKVLIEKEITDGLGDGIANAIAGAAKDALGVDSLDELDDETYALIFGGSPLARSPKKGKKGKP